MDRVFDLIQSANAAIESRVTIEAQPFAVEHIGPR